MAAVRVLAMAHIAKARFGALGKDRSRFPSGMTDRRAWANAKTEADSLREGQTEGLGRR
jgi:hypothetical protein